MKKYSEYSLLKSYKDQYRTESMISLGNCLQLPALVKSIGWRLVFICFDRLGKVKHRLHLLTIFVQVIFKMKKNHGEDYVVQYLKTSQLALQRRVGNHKTRSPRELNSKLPLPKYVNSGLPRIIPKDDRRAILGGSKDITRFWLTLFGIYRIIKVKGELKTQTITGLFSGDKDFLKEGSLQLKAIASRYKDQFDKSILSNERRPLKLIQSSSPSSATSWAGMFIDVFRLKGSDMLIHVRELMLEFSMIRNVKLIDFIASNPLNLSDFLQEDSNRLGIGKLSIKEEAAGKVRVFAMVDFWTQQALLPIHDFLFAFLKGLPNDGTFDQDASCRRAQSKALSVGYAFSFDLSAATDRLPIFLQKDILSVLISPKVADLWKHILVNRIYYLRDKEYGNHDLKYEVGQPMGALSSWAMLAVTHHFIVQLAYRRSHGYDPEISWFTSYELLGDDVVIFDELTANEYLVLMKGFGLEINLSKSIIAKNASFEFAKRTIFMGVDVSGISWKMFISNPTQLGRVNICYHLLNKMKPYKHMAHFMRNVMRKRYRILGDYQASLLMLLSMFRKSKRIVFKDLLDILLVPANYLQRSSRFLINNINIFHVENIIISLVKGLPVPVIKDVKRAAMSFRDIEWYKIKITDWVFFSVKKFGPIAKWKVRVIDSMLVYMVPAFKEMKRYDTMGNIVGCTNSLELLALHSRLSGLLDLVLFHNFDKFEELSSMKWLDMVKLDVDSLFELQEIADLMSSLNKISISAIEKDTKVVLSKNIVDQPLKLLTFLKKANKDRPSMFFDPNAPFSMEYLREPFYVGYR